MEQKRFRRWRKIWSISAKGESEPSFLKNINYGETSAGLAEIMTPIKFNLRESYRVSVSGTLLSGVMAYGVAVFHFSEEGEVIIAKGGDGVIISERK